MTVGWTGFVSDTAAELTGHLELALIDVTGTADARLTSMMVSKTHYWAQWFETSLALRRRARMRFDIRVRQGSTAERNHVVNALGLGGWGEISPGTFGQDPENVEPNLERLMTLGHIIDMGARHGARGLNYVVMLQSRGSRSFVLGGAMMTYFSGDRGVDIFNRSSSVFVHEVGHLIGLGDLYSRPDTGLCSTQACGNIMGAGRYLLAGGGASLSPVQTAAIIDRVIRLVQRQDPPSPLVISPTIPATLAPTLTTTPYHLRDVRQHGAAPFAFGHDTFV